MKSFVDRYIRSLKERDDHPESTNDLGTVVCWILEHHGYRILERAFKRAGVERRVSKGRQQHGIDILAVRTDENDAPHAFRFVLKRGAISKWSPGEEGSMAYDVWDAAGLESHERAYGVEPRSVTVIAVHNGDRDTEKLGTRIEDDLDKIRTKYSCKTEWWDAERLTTLIMDIAEPDATPGPSATLFPPRVQPFVRLAIDSLHPERGARGAGFDFAAVDSLLNILKGSNSLTDVHQRLTEFGLVASMIDAEAHRVAEGNLLPVLETIERVACAALAASVKLSARTSKAVHEALDVLLSTYAATAERLRQKIHPVASVPMALGLGGPGERTDYTLRVLRLSGYLAVAGTSLLHTGDNDGARQMAKTLALLWANNEGAAHTPLTDDHLIELVLVLDLWAALGMRDLVRDTSVKILRRLARRKQLGWPLPAVDLRARTPMGPIQIASLVAAFQAAPEKAGFNDGASTIIPALVFLADRLGSPLDAATREMLLGGERTISLQVWQPPAAAGMRWYSEAIELDGNAYMLEGYKMGLATIAEEFERAADPIQKSYAEHNGLPVIDRMAWKQTRTPPAMSVVCSLARALSDS